MAADRTERTLLIGLDGATFSLLDPFMQEGVMPFLKEFVSRGIRSEAFSTPHPLTPPAWTSLMTGRSPGNHGVFDFVRVETVGGQPRYTLATSGDICCETIWSIVSRSDRRVVSLNFPLMFPPKPVSGYIVPGFVPWKNLAHAVYPRELYKRLRTLPNFNPRELALDWDIERKALQGLQEEKFEEWIRYHIAREGRWFEIAASLVQEDPCDLTAVLFDGADKIQHVCWRFMDRSLVSTSPSGWERAIRELCLDYFRQLDGYIEKLVNLAGPDTRTFLISDHGFGPTDQHIFYVNVWLQQNGYLRWADGVAMDQEGRLTLEGHTGSEILFDWGWDGQPGTALTTAFALTASSNAVFIRRATGPDQPGILPQDCEAFRGRLAERLLAYVNPETGCRVVERVLTPEEAFTGSQMHRAPDLTLILHDHSFISVLNADAVVKKRRWTDGTHHPAGIFLAKGPGIPEGLSVGPISIMDVAPIVLYSLGLPIPEDLEGHLPEGTFDPSFLRAHPMRLSKPTIPVMPGETPRASLDVVEEEQVMARLKALGYME